MQRPQPSEYYEYYGRYIERVPDGDIIEILEQELQRTLDMLASVPAERGDYKYAPGKWSIKQVMGHVIDAERVFGYRALSFARRDPAHLPSMEQDEWAEECNAAERPLADLTEEFAAVRRSNIALFKSSNDELWDRRGMASGFEFSVRTFPYILAGHEIHHRTVLQERYLT